MKGKPDSEQKSIGKLDIATGKLWPNKNYFEIFPENKPVDFIDNPTRSTTQLNKSQSKTFLQVKSHGMPAALYEMANQTDLLETLKGCFPTKWEKMLAIACYMVSCGNVMSYISDWFHGNEVNFTKSFDDSSCSRLFESISSEEMNTFFSIWIKHHNEHESIGYDVTSVSTYSGNISLAEWGYNRDNDRLPQLNFGMFYGMTSRIPLFYKLYNGSIPDKSYFEFMMKNAMTFGINKVCFVFDAGFVTQDNITFAIKNQLPFLSVFPSTINESAAIIDRVKNKMERLSNRITGFNGFGVTEAITLYGHTMKAHIYLDLNRKASEFAETMAQIDELEEELEKINKSNTLPRRFSNYFKVRKLSKNKVDYQKDTDKIDEQISRAGAFILLTTNFDLTAEQALKMYREKDVIEKNFEQLKNDIDFYRLKTHRIETTTGKMFVGFIALIMRTYMLQTLKNSETTKGLTFKTVKNELNKIQSAVFSDDTRELAPLTKLQKNILATLKVNIKNILN
jgi:transposase